MPILEKISIIIDIISSIFVVIITLSAGIIAYRQLRNANLQTRYKGTSDLFDRFNSKEQRDNRRFVYHNCEKYLKIDKDNFSEPFPKRKKLDRIENICNYFDWVSLNVKNHLMSESDAVNIYGDSFVRCWVILRPWIEYKREKYGQHNTLWKNFEQFSDRVIETESYQQWKKEGVIIFIGEERKFIDYETSQEINR
jgi:hypothetical protein